MFPSIEIHLAQARLVRHRKMQEQGHLTLGALIDLLKGFAADTARRTKRDQNADPEVRFDFEYHRPDGLSSWRGDYSELAIHYAVDGELPLSAFLPMLEAAVGQEYEGWKGGDFVMTRSTPLWVANPGNAAETAVVGATDHGYKIVLHTAYRDYLFQ